jgi:hypothetical protein
MVDNSMTATNTPTARLSADGKTLAVHVPMQFRRRGCRKVVIAPAGTPTQAALPQWAKPQTSVDEALVKTLAQAFHFQRLLDEGHHATIGDLACAKKLDPSFVARVLRLTLLAPDIIQAILDGTQASAMQRPMLLRGLPLEWEEQRKRVNG